MGLLAMALAGCVALLVSELCARVAIAVGVPLDRTLLRISGTECRLAYDPVLGWRNVERSVERCHGEVVAINRIGLRGREIVEPKPSGTLRILALGDSFTWGWGAPADATYPSQLEERLRAAHPEQRIEVVNGGVSGYGTVQELLLLDRIGAAIQPDIVVLFYYRNDWRNNLVGFEYGYAKPDYRAVLASETGGAPPSVERPAAPVARMLHVGGSYYRIDPLGRWDRSGLGRIVLARAQASFELASALDRLGLARLEKLGAHPPGEIPPARVNATEISVALVQRVVERAAALGARTLVLVSPSTYALTEDTYRGGIDPEWLPAPLARAGIDTVDLFPILRERRLLHDRLCLSPTGEHFNRFGNGLVAEVVASELERRGWLQASAAAPAR
ncbi:MAG: GDSL-type esterase/lipase family protein [bacterium]